jgi:hypothetical protein
VAGDEEGFFEDAMVAVRISDSAVISITVVPQEDQPGLMIEFFQLSQVGNVDQNYFQVPEGPCGNYSSLQMKKSGFVSDYRILCEIFIRLYLCFLMELLFFILLQISK